MAQQDTNLPEINKGIQQVVKILSIGASPADQKKLAEMEAETAKTEKANADRKKTQQPKEQAYWSDNIKTWTQLGKFMTKGVKTWFNKQMKATGLLGSTLRMGANIWNNLNEHIIQNLRNAFGAITGHVKEVLGPVADAFGAVKDALGGVFKFFKGTIMGIGAKVKPEDKFRNKMLQKILAAVKPDKKAAFVEGLKKDKKPSGLGKFLLILGMVIAASLGAYLRKFLLPFEIAGKVIGKPFIKFFGWFAKIGKMIGGLLSKIPGVGKFFKSIGKLFSWIGKAFKWVGGIVMKVIGWVGKLAPAAGGLAKLGRAFMYGFKILGWPLTILIGIYDFIMGFIQTEGTLWDKFKGGFKAAIFGFIEMPIRFLAWLIEKVMGWFGVSVEGLGDKIMNWISGFLDLILDLNPLKPIFDFFTGFFGTEGTFVEKLKGGLGNMIAGVVNLFARVWNTMVEYAYKLLPDWVVNKLGIKKIDVPGGTSGGSTSDAESKNKEAQAAAKKKEMEEAEKARIEQERIAKEQLEATRAAGATTAAAVGGQGGQGGNAGGDIPQIPDEVDNWGVTSKNYDMEMGF